MLEAFGHAILIFLFTICAQYSDSPHTSWACSSTSIILLLFKILWICNLCHFQTLYWHFRGIRFIFMPLAKNTSVACLGSIFGTFGDIIFAWKYAVFIMERLFKLAGKKHYSNVSFRVGSIISYQTVLVYRHWFLTVLAFIGKRGAYLKLHVSQGK